MTNFNKIINRFPSGSIADTGSELGIVLEMWTKNHQLMVRILFARNIRKHFDLLIFNQESAQEYRLDQWRKSTPKAFAQEVKTIFGNEMD